MIAFGGPAPGDIEVLINGEFAVEFGSDPTAATPIDDMVVAGNNMLEIRMAAPEEPRGRTRHLQLHVAEIVQTSAHQRETQQPLVQVNVPDKLRSSGTECIQTAPFWAGPPPAREAAPKESYWLIIQGAPSTHWFTVSINGVPVFNGYSGDTFFEVTDFVIRGKNEVVYSATPTCMSRPTGRDDSLEFSISTGAKEIDTVRFDTPMAMYTFAPKEGKPAFEKVRVFRGR